jgi:hypothetical protein
VLEQPLFSAPFLHAVAFAASSDVWVLRCALARLVAKASGIGGGMAPFLATHVSARDSVACSCACVHAC